MKQLPLHAFFKAPATRAPPIAKTGKRKFIDFFCGCGGASQGAAQAGFDVVLAIDYCQDALRVHKLNHRSAVHLCTPLPAPFELPLPSPDEDWHLHGSPPCTHLSQANIERDPSAKADALKMVKWFLEFCMSCGATTWTMENVATKATIELLEAFRSAHRQKVAYAIVQCNDHGLPTTRRRLIAGSPRVIAAFRRLPHAHRTVRDVIPTPRGTHTRGSVVWAGHKEYKHYGPNDALHSIDKPAPCITARHTLFWATPKLGNPLVKMTPRETAIVQTFPEDYALDTSISRAIRQLGNSFPPSVAERLFSCC